MTTLQESMLVTLTGAKLVCNEGQKQQVPRKVAVVKQEQAYQQLLKRRSRSLQLLYYR